MWYALAALLLFLALRMRSDAPTASGVSGGCSLDTRRALGAAIQQMEGWSPGTRSYRNNNPGNLRYVGQPGAIGKDDAGFAQFPDFDTGFNALLRQIDLYCQRGLTLAGMTAIYAPSSDGNDPFAYAQFLANRLGVTVDTKLTDIRVS